MTRTTFALAVAAVMLTSSEAAACPAYSITVTQAAGTTYSPVDASDTPVILQLATLGGPQAPECADLPVTITGVAGSPQPLTFNGVGGTQLIADLTPGSDATLVISSLVLTPDARTRLVQGQPVNVQVGEFRAGQFMRAGTYTSTVRIVAGTSESTEALSVTVEPALLLQLSSADGVEEMLLTGDPQSGTSGSTVLFYRTNADLRVSAASLHGGALVHERGETTGRIPYNAALDGTSLNLGAGTAAVDFGFAHTNLQSRTLTVIVPATGPLMAGRYGDVITFSFAPY